MKNIISIVILMILPIALWAQKPQQGDITIGASFVSGSSLSGIFGGEYFIRNNQSLSISLGIIASSNTEANVSGQVINQSQKFSIGPAYTYYFKGTEKLAPFISGYLGFSADLSQNNNSYYNLSGSNSWYDINPGVSCGVRYYPWKHIYLSMSTGIGVNFYHYNADQETQSGLQKTITLSPSYNQFTAGALSGGFGLGFFF